MVNPLSLCTSQVLWAVTGWSALLKAAVAWLTRSNCSSQLRSPFANATFPAVPIPLLFDGQIGGGLRVPNMGNYSNVLAIRRADPDPFGLSLGGHTCQPRPDDG